MPSFDFTKLPIDLQTVEQRLFNYGAKAVASEISLNQLFINHLTSGGSRTRASLALAAGQTLDLPAPAAIAVATAVELLHQASLIHDDLQDNDATRRGQAAVWRVAGSSSAICLGDDLIGGAFQELAMIPESHIHHLPRLVTMLSKGISVMAAGQTLDCQWSPESEIGIEEYEEIVRHKSGPLLGLPIALILVLAGGSDDEVTQILGGASSIGIAYQLADDLLDRDDDRGHRLNGYWVLSERLPHGADPEEMLRARFEYHLEHARHSVRNLPAYCPQAFDLLIDALYQKYPALREAA